MDAVAAAFSHPWWLIITALLCAATYFMGYVHGFDVCEDDMREEEALRAMQATQEEISKWR